jgi:hypothetical protein
MDIQIPDRSGRPAYLFEHSQQMPGGAPHCSPVIVRQRPQDAIHCGLQPARAGPRVVHWLFVRIGRAPGKILAQLRRQPPDAFNILIHR